MFPDRLSKRILSTPFVEIRGWWTMNRGGSSRVQYVYEIPHLIHNASKSPLSLCQIFPSWVCVPPCFSLKEFPSVAWTSCGTIPKVPPLWLKLMNAFNSLTKSPTWYRSKKIITFSRSSLQIIKHEFTKWIFGIANIMPSPECENKLNYDLSVYTKNFQLKRLRSTGDLSSSLYSSRIQR